ncbi:MAG: DbpA RNA binding domain-containing protein, partial [Muribaculaceae bacterium]|nr:DbpA RNA binding domain-containing protein [Muribaculaceae bacterium]
VVGHKPEIGRIDLMPSYTLFDVRKKDARKVVDALRNADFFGRKIKAEYATDRDYTREAKDRRIKAEAKKKKADKPSARTNYEMSLKGEKTAKKKNSKKKEAAPKSKYNGNYDIFKKK